MTLAITVLVALMFSKFVYTSSLHSFYSFYMIDTFGASNHDAQIYLFVLLGAIAVGTFAGGPIGDRIGTKKVIWFSILGTLPFSLALPYANLFWTIALTIPIGLILSSAFSAMIVYAQELLPGRVGMISACSLDWPSASPDLEPSHSAISLTQPASSMYSRSAASCRYSASWHSFCRSENLQLEPNENSSVY